MEEWKDIEDYEGLYQVSSEGRVKSLNYFRTGEERILKCVKNKEGYLKVGLSKNRKRKTYYIHRLVAQTFLPNPNNLPQVNHKDEDKTNNIVENIEYCNSKYNANYGTRTERIQKPILQFTKSGEFVRRWESITQVRKKLGVNKGNITSCLKGKYKTAGGYIWMYAVINDFSIDINKLKKVA